MDLRIFAWSQIRDLALRAGSVVLLLLIAVVLLSVAILPDANWAVRIVLAGICVLALARPADALLVTSALLGFGIILSHLAGIPSLRVIDVLIAASLAGCIVHANRRAVPFQSAVRIWINPPVVLFALAAVASTIVWLRVYQVQSGPLAAYVHALIRFLTRDYFVQPGEFWLIVSAVAFVQGLGLYVAMAAFSQIDPAYSARALRMLTIGGAAVATMSFVRLAEIVLRNPLVLQQMRQTYAGLRISPQIPDYIAAGSYFALCWLASLGLAISGPRRWRVWVAVGLLLLGGLYLTGSRSVIAAALGGVIVFVVSILSRERVAVRAILIFGAVAATTMIVSFPFVVGHDFFGTTARQSLQVRLELLRAGLHVIAARPVFGVGIDRFYLVAGTVESPVLDQLWPSRRNPHNDLLRYAGELGLVGLGLFLAILIPQAARMWRALRSTGDARLAGLVGGLVAFLITSMFSNPLMLREVSYAFWIAFGLAAGSAATVQPAAHTASIVEPRKPSSVFRSSAAWSLAVLLVLSIPFRAKQELTTTDPTRVTYGLSDWETEADGTRFRWSGPQVTLFASARARRIEIPLRGTLPSGEPQHVKVQLNGRIVNDVVVGPDWSRLGIVLQLESATRPRRIDLTVSPTWVRTDLTTAADERSVVGVRVGELNVIR